MTISFRPATRENVGLLIGLAGPSGGGKSFSAMRLASGIAGDKPFAVIDTEARRALHYADTFRFDHAELRAPFRPMAYLEAIKAADDAGYPVICVDSFSHEHSGEGGVLDWHEEELARMAGDDYKRREAMKMAAWITPKRAHKAMVQRLLQVRAHLILCFRAEDKVDMVRGDDGKMKIVQKETLSGFKGWIPICDKNLPFELTASFILTPDRPGIPQPIKLQEQHRALFPGDKPISEESGRRLAEWARGGATSGTSTLPDGQVSGDKQPGNGRPAVSGDDPAERARLIADATRLGRSVLQLTVKQWNEAANKHTGAADLNAAGATVATLTALVNELRERAGESAWGDAQAQSA